MEEHREIDITTQTLPAQNGITNDTAIIEMGEIFIDSSAVPEQAHVGPGFALSVSANHDASIAQAGALGINAGHDVDIQYGGAMAINVGRSADIQYGGAMWINAGGAVDVDYGGAWAINAAKGAKINNSTVGVLISPKAELGEGSRVILNTPQAIAFGAAFGIVFALVRWLRIR